MQNLNQNPGAIDSSLNTKVTPGFEAPYVSDKEQARINGVKLDMQIALMEEKFGHTLGNDESPQPEDNELIASWMDMYAERVNDYFRAHPDATTDDLDKIKEYITRDRAVH